MNDDQAVSPARIGVGGAIAVMLAAIGASSAVLVPPVGLLLAVLSLAVAIVARQRTPSHHRVLVTSAVAVAIAVSAAMLMMSLPAYSTSTML